MPTNPITQTKGRFAPSPTGRMHLGNIFTALMSWLSAHSKGGKWVLRIEDLDPQRSRYEYACQIEDDLHWLGLDWDEGGLDGKGTNGPYSQSLRGNIYAQALEKLRATRLTYPCFCTRAGILATQAPHQSDGRIVYQGTCRPAPEPPFATITDATKPHATRLYVPDREIDFTDTVCGHHSVNLAAHCGDFVLRRADGAYAYQLAVVVDDALMGITEVVRGNDLLLSTAQQIYLYELLGHTPPTFTHLPLLCNRSMQRLSKRDQAMNMSELRLHHTPEEIIGKLADIAGLIPQYTPCRPADLITSFTWQGISSRSAIVI